MKKYRKQLLRITSLLCCMVLILSAMIVPASAADFDNYSFIDLFEYNNLDTYYKLTSTNNSITFSLPDELSVGYIDFVYNKSSASVTSISVVTGIATTVLTPVQVSGSLYRCFGDLPDRTASSITLTFDNTADLWITFMSLKIATVSYSHYSDIGYMDVRYNIISTDSGIDSSATMDNPSSTIKVTFLQDTSAVGFYDYRARLYCNNWVKYDYVDFIVQARVGSVDSLSAYFGDVVLPFEFSYIDTSSSDDYFALYDGDLYTNWADSDGGIINLAIRVDLRGLDRTLSGTPVVEFHGIYDASSSALNYISLYDYSGYVELDTVNPVSFWFSNLSSNIAIYFGKLTTSLSSWFNQSITNITSNFNSLKDHLSDLFHADDTAEADEAMQTQEELNVSINSQIVGAVEDWDTNIETVQTGYDKAFLNITPALAWLGSLADGIFTNMGWFGNVYFLVGIMSVFMLILSKSGLASKIGGAIRRNK